MMDGRDRQWQRGVPATRPGSLPSGRAVTPTCPESPPLVPGAVVAGSYRVHGKLGEGAMGVVLAAHDLGLDREVAIKVIHPRHLSFPQARARFLLEARTMARIRHAHVVEVYALGEHQDVPYFVMEYVEGTTLEHWIARHAGSRRALGEAVDILAQVARGVRAIHRAGAVHRDIKPSNVLLSRDHRAAVTDLGLARMLDDAGVARGSGTPAYMAPEVLLKDPLPPRLLARSDVWSLGALAYEMLTGRRPFQNDVGEDRLWWHVASSPAPPSTIADVPPAFDGVLLRALARNAEDRTESPELLRAGLLQAARCYRRAEQVPRLLLVDDDEDHRRMVGHLLATAFPTAELLESSTGVEGLEAVRDSSPDLAIVDLDMPDLDGEGFLEEVRSTREHADLPILIATAKGGPAEWARLSRLGANAFLVKPLDARQLVHTVEGLLDRRASAAWHRGTP